MGTRTFYAVAEFTDKTKKAHKINVRGDFANDLHPKLCAKALAQSVRRSFAVDSGHIWVTYRLDGTHGPLNLWQRLVDRVSRITPFVSPLRGATFLPVW